MRILVSGASGFIGRHAVRSLLNRGDSVLAVCQPGATKATLQVVGRPLDVISDSGSADSLATDLARHGFDATLHLAGRLDAEPGLSEIDGIVEANVGFAARFAAAAAATAPDSVFVNAETVWQYANADGAGAASLYAATKRAFAEILTFYGAHQALDVRSVVLPWVYGPDQPRTGIVAALLAAVETGETLDATSGDGVLDLLHVDDVVAGLSGALEPGLGSGRWMLSSGAGLTVRELSANLGVLADRPVPVGWGSRPDRATQPKVVLRPAPLLPGWQPRVPLDDGLLRLLERSSNAAPQRP